MMNWLKAVAVAFGPRLIGVGVTAVGGWIYAHTKGAVSVNAEQATGIVVGALTTYAASHRIASSLINPGDAAKGRVAEAIKDAAATGTSVRVSPPNT